MRFSDIPGQLEIKEKLIKTVSEHRVSHAQLFYGPDNSAKLALAIAYAQYINCRNRQAPGNNSPIPNPQSPIPDSCGTCPSCIKYQKLIHPDLHFIFPVAATKTIKKPQSKLFISEWRNFFLQRPFPVNLQDWYDQIGIENKQGIINKDDCNEIISTLSYKSYESEYKVMIIWMVEKLYYAAAPKILKILEEPPEKTLFLLVSENPEQIINTIQSRCLMVRIPPDNKIIRPPEGETESKYFQGFRDWMRLIYKENIPGLIKFSTEIARTGREKQKAFLQYGLYILSLSPHAVAGQAGRIIFDPEEEKFIGDFAPVIMSSGLAGFYELFNSSIYYVERNAYAPALFLDLSFKILRLFKPNFLPL